MEANDNSIKLYYNTEREKLQMPEYGRNVLRMVEQLKEIPDKAKQNPENSAADSMTRTTLTKKADSLSSFRRRTRTTVLASPSFTPGTGTGRGNRLST